MHSPDYFSRVKAILDADPRIDHGVFDVFVHGKGADHHDLLQIKKHDWQVPTEVQGRQGYEGIEVHYEACRPGHWVLHCELYPRQPKAKKELVRSQNALLEYKREITLAMRERGRREGWMRSLGAHLRRTRADCGDPSSLIVYTFELDLSDSHTPEEFVARVVPIVEQTRPVIDEVLVPYA